SRISVCSVLMRSLGAGVAWSSTRLTLAGSQTCRPPISSNALSASGAVVSVAIAPSTGTMTMSPARTSSPALSDRVFSAAVRGSGTDDLPLGAGAAPQPVDRAGQLDREHALGRLADGADAVDVDARRHAQHVEQVDHVLGGDVAGRAGDERTAAQAAEGRIEARDALPERDVEVGQRQSPGVVQVQHQRQLAYLEAHAAQQALDVERGGEAGRVGQRQLGDA